MKMKKLFKNYLQLILIVVAIIIGCIFGLIFGEKTTAVQPLGDLFLNMMFIIMVPIIFVTVALSISKMDNAKKFGKILLYTIISIAIMSVIAALVANVCTHITNLISGNSNFNDLKDSNQTGNEKINYLASVVNLISVSDFVGLFSRNNIFAIFIFAIIFGFAVRMCKEKQRKSIVKVLSTSNDIINKLLKIIMFYAPIGLGCYFAVIVGTFEGNLVAGFLKTLLLYCVVCLAMYIVIYTLVAFVCGGRKGVKAWYKNILTPTITALGTCSSAASLPVGIEYTKKMGVSNDVVETVMPFGTNFHKSGSIIGSVFKICFVMSLIGVKTNFVVIILVAILVTLLVGAVPTGGATISEAMILTLLGWPLEYLPLLIIIATIIDAPATVLNVVGNMSTSVMVDKFVNKKTFISKNDQQNSEVEEIVIEENNDTW